MASLACCRPFENEGEPQGKFEEYNSIKTYVAPYVGTPEYAIILLTDIFAISNNVKLLADRYAKMNPKVMCVVPDYFPGGACDAKVYPSVNSLLAPKPTDTFWGKCYAVGTILWHAPAFLIGNSQTKSCEIAEKVINLLRKEKGIKKVAAIGYCWGGSCCLILGKKDHLLDVIVPSHPAPPKLPGDITALKCPICFVHAEKDGMVTTKQVESVSEILRTRQPPLKHLVKICNGQVHGFAIRGDDKDEAVKKAKEEAEAASFKFIAEVFEI